MSYFILSFCFVGLCEFKRASLKRIGLYCNIRRIYRERTKYTMIFSERIVGNRYTGRTKRAFKQTKNTTYLTK